MGLNETIQGPFYNQTQDHVLYVFLRKGAKTSGFECKRLNYTVMFFHFIFAPSAVWSHAHTEGKKKKKKCLSLRARRTRRFSTWRPPCWWVKSRCRYVFWSYIQFQYIFFTLVEFAHYWKRKPAIVLSELWTVYYLKINYISQLSFLIQNTGGWLL